VIAEENGGLNESFLVHIRSTFSSDGAPVLVGVALVLALKHRLDKRPEPMGERRPCISLMAQSQASVWMNGPRCSTGPPMIQGNPSPRRLAQGVLVMGWGQRVGFSVELLNVPPVS
jgi:hypothetical protein